MLQRTHHRVSGTALVLFACWAVIAASYNCGPGETLADGSITLGSDQDLTIDTCTVPQAAVSIALGQRSRLLITATRLPNFAVVGAVGATVNITGVRMNGVSSVTFTKLRNMTVRIAGSDIACTKDKTDITCLSFADVVGTRIDVVDNDALVAISPTSGRTVRLLAWTGELAEATLRVADNGLVHAANGNSGPHSLISFGATSVSMVHCTVEGNVIADDGADDGTALQMSNAPESLALVVRNNTLRLRATTWHLYGSAASSLVLSVHAPSYVRGVVLALGDQLHAANITLVNTELRTFDLLGQVLRSTIIVTDCVFRGAGNALHMALLLQDSRVVLRDTSVDVSGNIATFADITRSSVEIVNVSGAAIGSKFKQGWRFAAFGHVDDTTVSIAGCSITLTGNAAPCIAVHFVRLQGASVVDVARSHFYIETTNDVSQNKVFYGGLEPNARLRVCDTAVDASSRTPYLRLTLGSVVAGKPYTVQLSNVSLQRFSVAFAEGLADSAVSLVNSALFSFVVNGAVRSCILLDAAVVKAKRGQSVLGAAVLAEALVDSNFTILQSQLVGQTALHLEATNSTATVRDTTFETAYEKFGSNLFGVSLRKSRNTTLLLDNATIDANHGNEGTMMAFDLNAAHDTTVVLVRSSVTVNARSGRVFSVYDASGAIVVIDTALAIAMRGGDIALFQLTGLPTADHSLLALRMRRARIACTTNEWFLRLTKMRMTILAEYTDFSWAACTTSGYPSGTAPPSIVDACSVPPSGRTLAELASVSQVEAATDCNATCDAAIACGDPAATAVVAADGTCACNCPAPTPLFVPHWGCVAATTSSRACGAVAIGSLCAGGIPPLHPATATLTLRRASRTPTPVHRTPSATIVATTVAPSSPPAQTTTTPAATSSAHTTTAPAATEPTPPPTPPATRLRTPTTTIPHRGGVPYSATATLAVVPVAAVTAAPTRTMDGVIATVTGSGPVAAIATSGAGGAVLVSALVLPSTASQASRTASVVRVATCAAAIGADDDDELQPSRLEHPFYFRFGSGPAAAMAGAALSSSVVVVCAWLGLAAAAHSIAPDGSATGVVAGAHYAFALATAVLSALLVPGIAAAATSVATASAVGVTSVQRFVSVAGGVVAICVVAASAMIVTRGFRAAVLAAANAPEVPAAASRSSVTAINALPLVGPCFARRWGLFFDAARDPDVLLPRAYYVVDVAAAVVTAVVTSVPPASMAHCVVVLVVIGAVNVAFAVYVLRVRPYADATEQRLTAALACIQLLGVAAAAAALFNNRAIAVLGVILLLQSVWFLVTAMVLAYKALRSPDEKDAAVDHAAPLLTTPGNDGPAAATSPETISNPLNPNGVGG